MVKKHSLTGGYAVGTKKKNAAANNGIGMTTTEMQLRAESRKGAPEPTKQKLGYLPHDLIVGTRGVAAEKKAPNSQA
ncbi:MAG: hypothetical protein ABI282_08365 [Candidatus Baltobacteraceae bacterium]